MALNILGEVDSKFIIDYLETFYESPDNCRNIVRALSVDPKAIRLLRASLNPSSPLPLQAKRVILLAHLGDYGPWIDAATARDDLSLCTEVVHLFPVWNGEVSDWLAQLSQDDPALHWPLCQAISLLDQRSLRTKQHSELTLALRRLVNESSDYSVVASAEHVLAKWGGGSRPGLPTIRNIIQVENGPAVGEDIAVGVASGPTGPLQEIPGLSAAQGNIVPALLYFRYRSHGRAIS